MGAAWLLITADDYGYSARYDAGILEAAQAKAIDAVSAMVLRPGCDPGPLRQSAVEVGLHIELPEAAEAGSAAGEPRRQLQLFERLFGAPPTHLDGHHHCHAVSPLAEATEELAIELGVRVRAIGAAHRDRLRTKGIEVPDRLVGRIEPSEPVLPTEVEVALEGGQLPEGLTEWMVHPGYADPDLGSSFDAAREEDLALLLRLAGEPRFAAIRVGRTAAPGA